jgi:hypothetical protein
MDTIELDQQHEHLLQLADRIEAAAHAVDRPTLRALTSQFLHLLARHLDDEWTRRTMLAPATREAMIHHEQRLIEDFVNLAHEAATCSTTDCDCGRRASGALSQLRDQIEAEAPAEAGKRAVR